MLGELEQVARLQRRGRITGLDAWLEFGAAKDARDLGRIVGELREARRLMTENPGAVINVGGDAKAPRDLATGNRLASFDLTLERADGRVRRSIEVTTVDDPVSQPDDLTKGVIHATDKVEKRHAAGQPIPGFHEVTIRMMLRKHKPLGRAGHLAIDSKGDIVQQTPQGRSISKGNMFDQFGNHLPNIPSHIHLDRVTLADSITGEVLAEFERAVTVWKRIR